ncbi:hypothetical protein uan_084 [Pseudomonas phage UAntarctica]|nr:hypothetical protein uan_084 [Pseudomonas phage UAntarctica]
MSQGTVKEVARILDELVNQVGRLTTKGLLPEGDIEGLERAAGKAELFMRPQAEEPGLWIAGLADAPFSGLTAAEAERLDILAEECAEVIQAIMKIKRHGFESYHPGTQELNRTALLREITDVKAAMVMVSRDIPEVMVDDMLQQFSITRALNKKLEYCHHQGDDFKEYIATLGMVL